MAGEEGTRIFPTSADRATPAIRFGGSYRLIDLTLSNCVNSDIRQILIFPQHQTSSLEDHLRLSWSSLSQGRDDYVMSVPPPRLGGMEYRGTADTVYQNLCLLERINPIHVLILGGDHVYPMDYRLLLQFHQARGADVTAATFLVPRHQSSKLGSVTIDTLGKVTSFQEHPWEVSTLSPEAPAVLAPMGIYLFRFAVLREVLGEDAQRQSTHDLGREILPGMLGRYRVEAFPFIAGMGQAPTHWQDRGTIDTSGEAHMDLVHPQADIQLSHPLGLRYASPAPGPALLPRHSGALGTGRERTNPLLPPSITPSRSMLPTAARHPGFPPCREGLERYMCVDSE
jgi:glucose-1-phosphate adenylyltransferase